MQDSTYALSGMHCSACTKLCTLLLKKLPAVRSVIIDDQAGTARIQSESPLDLSEANALLHPHGYTLSPTV